MTFIPDPLLTGPPSSDEKTRIGYLTCKICGQNFSTPTNALSAPIDVYTDWLDACESLNA
jgi:transcription elongation factor Elf1